MKNYIIVDGEKHEIYLERTDDGVDVCISHWSGTPYICEIRNDGRLKLYRDVNSKLFKRGENNCIITTKEWEETVI